MQAIYLDNNATTQVDEAVVEAMVDALRTGWGNPSSLHAFGEHAAGLVERARGAVARLVGARSPDEIVFTSGGTESINTALFAALASRTGGRVLAGATEHSAVLCPLERYASLGLEVERVAVDREGRIDVEQVLARLDEDCALVTLHLANNETGALLPEKAVESVARRATELGVPFHLDAVQAPGKLPLSVQRLGVDFASFSAHKFHGPKGVGALYVRKGRALTALVAGGPQEAERRGGTQNVPGIVGMGRAAELARAQAEDPAALRAVAELRDRLEAGLLERLDGARAHATGGPRLGNTSSLHVPGIDGELFLAGLAAEGLAVSGGAACSSRRRGPSPVLLAMGCDADEASRTVRFSLSRRTTAAEVDAALELVPRVHGELAQLQP